jgi:hypothetical protein
LIDEKTVRKPTFDEANSAPVVLGDGQSWFLPKPWLEVRPVFRGGRAVDTLPVMTTGPEFDALRDAVHAAEGDDIILTAANLAAYMLSRNYDLADEQFATILAFRDGATWLRDVVRHAAGVSAPKAGCAGDA